MPFDLFCTAIWEKPELIAMSAFRSFFMCFVVAAAIVIPISAQLSPDFYDKLCPQALPTIRSILENAIYHEPRLGASLLRVHFHDCFVNGCDASVLLDDTPNFTGEKTAGPNLNSLRGFEVIDEIKEAVNSACCGNVVSCADILAVAARDSVAILGGPSYQVLLGRRDARTASLNDANSDIPRGHTIGLARCTNFRDRIYNETNIKPKFAASLRGICPKEGGDDNTATLDATTANFDTEYFKDLLKLKGLLHSDQELFKGVGSASDGLVQYYSNNPGAFFADFGVSMIKMGNMKPLTGSDGEIRMNCRKIN
ncbi:Cationic peroxidase 1 [Vitis vinifera]|uniref:Peroxidase n=1 Tax=Vitis vinifera TaxID=29760 RepID=A0A438F913_VITVI|nr:Cationic peroxidase 1 [Vitis vinifera]